MSNINEPAIVVRNVSKKHRLFENARDRLKEALHPFSKRYHQEFWALQGISFEVPRGQTIGILGRNGSGKSTLLQIITGIMQPTSGEVFANGRISALLELGAGFNPDFTGRENSIFQAEVVGMSREEIDRKLPEIEKFADIGEFFDQPIKVYSSGMFVRVAFAAAISVDPDILIVDEALSVGDAEFQQRCFAKFKEFQKKGVTIVFVTHDIESVVRHCQHAILLEEGKIVNAGLPKDVIAEYINLMEGRNHLANSIARLDDENQQTNKVASDSAPTDELSRFLCEKPSVDACTNRHSYNAKEHHQSSVRAMIVDYLIVVDGIADVAHVRSGQMIDVYFKIHFYENVPNPCYGLALKTTDGVTIYALNSQWTGAKPSAAVANEYRIVHFRLPLMVNSGDIFLDFGVDETRNVGDYINLTRRMAVSHLVVQATRSFHGLVDLNATVEDIIPEM